ncbi:mucin-5AC-like isoform X2 [Daphnia pulex]|uniref:mucin-5AC-like isoform X2 n=1 Tax=Daphnia pulex TaxID=6669 RepID=UPI001EDFD6B9|nr:mucin-5AC-like isoform X2 [Daphnia pulex]
MTATIGVTFGAGSAAKRILLFAINVTVLLLGLTCSVLCLYQVKLMPETYEVIVAAIQESNLTLPTAEPVTSLPSVTISKNNNNTTRTTKKGRPRVGPKNGTSRNPQIPPFPVTLVDNFSTADEVPTLTISFGTLDVTKPVTLSQTTTTTPTIGSTMAKTSTSTSRPSSLSLVTSSPIKNNSDEMVNFGQLLKDRIAELENELRIAQSFKKLPIAEFNFSNTQTSWTMAATTLTSSRSSESIPATFGQQPTLQTNTTSTPTTAIKSTVGLVSVLLSTSSTANPSISSTPTIDGLSSVSSQTLVGTSPTTTTTAPTEKSTGIVTTSTTEWPTTSTPTTISTTTTPVTKSTTTSTRSVTTPTPETSTTSSTTVTTSSTEIPVVVHSTSTPETTTTATTSLDPSTTPVFTPSTTPVIHQSVTATTTQPPTTTLISSPSTEATTASTTTVMPTTPVQTTTASSSRSPSTTTHKAATTLMTTATKSPVGFIDLTDIINKLVGRRDLSARPLRNRRASATTVAPAVSSSDTLTADHIPVYFEQVFFLVQTSLYVCTAAGLLIFFSSLVGICGGLFRIDGCLKFSVAALVLVIMAEMATSAFIFFAHDKASNRNKNKNFDRDLKLLCELAYFCVQPMLLVITGSFLCVSVVLQIGSITLACNLMDNRTESDPDKKLRRMMRSGRSDFQFASGNSMYNNPYTNPMPMPCCGGGGYGGYGGMGAGHHLPYPPSMMMPMQNMYPPVFTGPGQRPIVNIIS